MKCKWCDNEFEEKYTYQKFCCNDCRKKYNSKNQKPHIKNNKRLCKECGKLFKVSVQNRKYCSDECKLTVTRRRSKKHSAKRRKLNPYQYKREIKKCFYCGKEFETIGNECNKIYCSDECRKEGIAELSIETSLKYFCKTWKPKGNIKRQCNICGQEFTYNATGRRMKYCSEFCATIALKENRNV